MKLILNVMLLCLLGQAHAAGKIQNEDVKSLTDIQSLISITGTLSSGSACISSPSTTTGISAGLYAYDKTTSGNIVAGTTVLGIGTGSCLAGQIQLSNSAAGAGSGDTITFGGQASQLVNASKIWSTALSSTLDSAITTGQIGSGSGGSKNYLANGVVASTANGAVNVGNGDFERGSTTGWALAHSAMTNNIPTSTSSAGNAFSSVVGGSAAASSQTFSVVSTGQLSKNYSGNFASNAASTAGDMLISSAFYVDRSDQGKTLAIKFNYQLASGAANVSLTGVAATQTFSIWAYDVTNGAWIQPSGVYNITGGGATPPPATATFQLPSNTTQLQLAVINNVASAGAYSLYVDDFSVGPQSLVNAPVMQDVKPFTASGTWTTNTTYAGVYSRRGDLVSGKIGLLLSGAPNNVSLLFNFIPGLTIDTTKLAYTARTTVGRCETSISGAAYTFELDLNGTNNSQFEVVWQSNTSGGLSATNATQPTTWANTNVLNCTFFDVPVVGWSSNAISSADIGVRPVQFFAQGNTTATSLSTTLSQIIFPTVVSDNYGSYSSSTGLWTAQQPVCVNVQAQISANATFSTNQGVALYVQKNGSGGTTVAKDFRTSASGANNLAPNAATNSVCLKPSDTLSVWANTNTGNATLNTGAGSTDFAFTIGSPASNQLIQATDSVSAIYNTISAQSIASATSTTIVYNARVRDTLGSALNTATGVYTCAVSGQYDLYASAGFQASANGSQRYLTAIQSGSTSVSYLGNTRPPTTGVDNIVSVAASFYCLQGDQLKVNAYQDSGSALALTAQSGENYINIKRVGN